MMQQTSTEQLSIERPVDEKGAKRGQWTYADYLRLPNDGKRYEIINGVLYMANAPSYNHQFAVTKLARLLDEHVDQHKLGVVLVAPFEIHLSETAKPVQPDVFFIPAERQPKMGDKYFEGAPDLIIEVISPSAIRTDRYIKFAAYELAGVREYWLVDPRLRFIEVYTRSSDTAEYELEGQFVRREQLHSTVLPDLVLTVDSVFVPLPT